MDGEKAPPVPLAGTGREGSIDDHEPIDAAIAVAKRQHSTSRAIRPPPRLVRLCRLGQRAVVEFIIDFGSRTDELELLEERIARYNTRLNTDFLVATGGDRFAARPMWLVSRSDR